MANRFGPEPRFRDLVYNGEWEQPNGFVVRVFRNYQDDTSEVLCKSWENGQTSMVDLDDLRGTWVETKTGGYWAITEPPTPEEIHQRFYKPFPFVYRKKFKLVKIPRVVRNNPT